MSAGIRQSRDLDLIAAFDGEVRILITGSRTWRNPASIAEALDARLDALPASGALTVVVGYDPDRRYPPGVDEFVYEYCESIAEFAERVGKTLAVETHPADWKRYRRRAGHIRNAEMVNLGAAECLAFVDWCDDRRCPKRGQHGSHGAVGCAGLADKAGIPVVPFGIDRKRWAA
jgi:hypothetical protein